LGGEFADVAWSTPSQVLFRFRNLTVEVSV